MASAEAVIASMRKGWIDSLEGQVEFRRADGASASAFSWTVPLGSKPPHESALLGAVSAKGERQAAFDAYRVDPGRVILGALDHDWRFSDVAVRGAALLGWPAGEEGRARVQEIVHPGDAPVLLASLGRAAVGQDAATIRVRVRGVDGGWLAALITVSPLCSHASPRFGVAISLLDGADAGTELDRASRVEEQLWRLATEVRAGLQRLPVGMTYVGGADLTPRQNEVVRRLAQGQRVEGIARDLFVSPSTVRNHLSAIYRKLGVSSQSQLVDKLRAQQQTVR